MLPFALRTPLGRLSFLPTVARFGTASDVTVAELSIESSFRADAETARRVEAAGRTSAGGTAARG